MADTSKKKSSMRASCNGRLGESWPSPVAFCGSPQDKWIHPANGSFLSPSKSFCGVPNAKSLFGSPSYPSPLDRIRTGKQERAKQLGLLRTKHDSYEANQSFPKSTRRLAAKEEIDVSMENEKFKKTLDQFKGEGLNDVSYSAAVSRGSFSATPEPPLLNASLDKSWAFYNYVGATSSMPGTVRNPNKAIVTINARTTEILIANEMACELFDFQRRELIGTQLCDLLSLKSKSPGIIQESHLQDNGEIIEVSGKVMDAVDASGLVFPVSVWVKNLETEESRCVVVMEPVERTTATVTFDSTGTVLDCDNQLADLHGYMSSAQVMGLKINTLIPSIKLPTSEEEVLPKDIKKQRATGRTQDGATFPLSIRITPADDVSCCHDNDNLDDTKVYVGVIWVFANISGMITFLPNGSIHSINNNLALLLFGYTSEELMGKDVSVIFPSFYDDLDLVDLTDSMPLPPMDEEDVISVKPPSLSCPSDDQGIGGSFSSSATDHIHNDNIDSPVFTTETQNLLRPENNQPDVESTANNLAKLALSPNINTKRGSSGKSPMKRKVQDNDVNTSKHGKKIQDNDVNTSKHGHKIQDNDIINTKRELDVENVDPNASTNKAELEIVNALQNVDLNSNSNCQNSDTKVKESVQNALYKSAGTVGKVGNLNLESTVDLLEAAKELGGTLGTLQTCDTKELLREADQYVNAITKCEHKTVDDAFDIDNIKTPARLIKDTNTSTPKHSTPPIGNTSGNSKSESRIFADIQNMLKSPESASSCVNGKLFKSDNEENVNISSNKSSKTNSILNKKSPESPRLQVNWKSPMSTDSGLLEENNVDNKICLDNLNSKNNDKVQQKTIDNVIVNNKENVVQSPTSLTPRMSRSSRVSRSSVCHDISDGSYVGKCVHRDNTKLGVIYQIKRVQLDDGQTLFCMWVSRDPADPGEGGKSFSNLTLASSVNSTAMTTGLGYSGHSINHSNVIDEEQSENSTNASTDKSAGTEEERTPTNPDEYETKYETLQSIGKGAFGFVKIAKRKMDKTDVVVKFIRKQKVFTDSWVDDDVFGKIPLEVSLLSQLEHPNIVRFLDCFEDPEFFQVVMEKHGCGMDLFEFIDRCPNLDEALASYIFRQIVSPISYMHNLNIVHRDIKDENIILDEQFNIKLIDFGSAAFSESGRMFGTFCGTVEYCSPEVLMGNTYAGPELEMWSIGVTLYTLVFGENPFYDIEETIKCVLKPPFEVSQDLMEVIAWLLHPKPTKRATVEEMMQDPWVWQPIDIDDYSWAEVLPNTEFTGNTAADNRPDTPPEVARGHSPDTLPLDPLDCSYEKRRTRTVSSAYDSDASALEQELQRCLIMDDEGQQF